MEYNLIADSSCDITDAFREEHQVKLIPFTLSLGNRHFIDDDDLDVSKFVEEMKMCKEKITTAAPSPQLYEEAIRRSDGTSFIVTISSRLSASYSNAMVAKSIVEQDGHDVHVFDSKSAVSGEALVAMKLVEYIKAGLPKAEIISTLENFIKNMHTFFVLDKVDNLLKNGRLNKIAGKLITTLNIKPVLGSDGDGNIAMYSKARGAKQIVQKLAETMDKYGSDTDGKDLVIAHCNNPSLAESFEALARARYNFRSILVVKTRGLSSLYSDDRGLVIAY